VYYRPKSFQPNALKATRMAQNIRQREVAAHLGVKQTVIRDWEIGRNRPTYEQVVAMADFLGCNIGELLTETEKPQGRIKRKAPHAEA
jgi:transcriptional regulator with XRE-family HTH domain